MGKVGKADMGGMVDMAVDKEDTEDTRPPRELQLPQHTRVPEE